MSYSNKFITNVAATYGQEGKRWLTELPHIVANLADLWQLEGLESVKNLSYNYVLEGWRGAKLIILKLSFNHKALQQEIAALKAFAGFGVASVLAEAPGALLLERAVSGVPLGSSEIEMACQVANKLHQAPKPQQGFPHISEWLAILDQEWSLPEGYLLKARQLKNKMLKVSGPEILLHGDLHYNNILQNEDDWLVIDPKGVIGHPIHEIPRFINKVEQDTEYAAQFFGFDLQQVRECCFVHFILASIWSIEDNCIPDKFLKWAEELYNKLC